MESSNEAQPGRLVGGRYRLDKLIGRGGAGSVWRSYDERLDRPLAVKEIIWPADPQAAGPERALREARAAARLRDPGVVQVYDILTENDRAYLLMELVDAPSLQHLVEREGPLSPARAAALGARILTTLTAAHAAGIVHRDVKPSNVLVEGDTPRLTDFGIARLGDDPALTATGVVMGTPSFIAPEQARGGPASPAVDLYGLGATLYFAVEGAAPFAEETQLQTALAVMNDPPRRMRRAGELRGLIEALLQKDPEARPDAEEVRQRLERVASATGGGPDGNAAVPDDRPAAGAGPTRARTSSYAPTVARPAGDEPRDPAPSPRRGPRASAIILALVAVVLLVTAGLTLLRDGEGDTPPETATEPATEGGDQAPVPGDGPATDEPARQDTPAEQPTPSPTGEPPTEPTGDEGEPPGETEPAGTPTEPGEVPSG